VRRLRTAGAGILALALVALGLAACVPVKEPGPPLLVTTSPSLFPAFQTGVADYVVRCNPPTPTAVNVDAPAGTTVSVNGSPPASGAYTVQVPQAVGQRFTIDVTTGGNTTNHHVRCLPTDFPTWTVEKSGVPQSEFYATTLVQGFGQPSYSVIFDANGVPVWWLDRKPTFLLQPLPNDNLAILNLGGAMEEYNLNGDLVRTLNTVGGDTDFHEVIMLPNGNYVMATVQEQPCNLTSWGLGILETCLNHVFQELTPQGVPVWQWDTALHIPVTETTPDWRAEQTSEVRESYDPWHYNSIEPTGDGYILGFRHLDAIYKVENTVAGNIVWKLGGTAHPESLTLVNDPLNGFSGQHDARLLPDGSVTLYDNGTLGLGPRRPPRNVRYALNLQANTATLIEQISDGAVTQSGCCGSTRRLSGGNYVTGWGGTAQFSEYDPNGNRVFRIIGTFVYRATPTVPGQFTAQELRDGMDAQFAP
jgi:hypothetical protein